MRIALIVTGGLHPSGREQVVPVFVWLIERLSHVHEVHAFVLRHLEDPATYPLAGATIHDLGRPKGPWLQWKALRRALNDHGPFDVIHGFWAEPAGVLASIAGRRLGAPTVVTCDTGEFSALPDIEYGLQLQARGRTLVKLVCRLATSVHVTTRFMETLSGIRGCRVVRIPMGVDLARVAAPAARVDGPPWTLLQIASLNRVKDQNTLLQALAIARGTLDVRLDLVGEDTRGGTLRDLAVSLGLSDAVTLHGFVPHDELGTFHRSAHLYVQSSRHEGGGMAVLEAAAAGLPIVGTQVGHVSDLAPHGAVAVRPADPSTLAAAIVRLLQSPQERYAIADVARQVAVSHDADWTARELMALYASLARARTAQRG